MSRTDDVPEDVWAQADMVGEEIYGRHDRGFVLWPLPDHLEKKTAIARALLAERNRAIAKIDEEIERAREFGPHHIPVLSAIKRAIRGDI